MTDLAEQIVDALFQSAQAGDGAMSRDKMVAVVKGILANTLVWSNHQDVTSWKPSPDEGSYQMTDVGDTIVCNAKDLPVYGEWTKIGGHDDLATWQRSA